MRIVKEYLEFAVLIGMFITAVFLLTGCFRLYQNAYSRLIDEIVHYSIEMRYDVERGNAD